MKTCKEKALEWNVSPRSVNDMCKKGRIQGAIKEKGSWLIPDDSPKPMDGRVSNGKYIKKNMVAKAEVKSLPIGISDYVRAQEEYYYVDKTLLVKEFLEAFLFRVPLSHIQLSVAAHGNRGDMPVHHSSFALNYLSKPFVKYHLYFVVAH